MTKLILLVTLALAFQLVKGQVNPPDPVGTVTCHNNHTVDITITNVDDRDEWTVTEWQLQGKAACEPTFPGATTVTYTGLKLPDCSISSEQLPESIKYVLKVSAKKGAGAGPGEQLRAYDHLYYVSCEYDNQDNTSVASFIPIVNRKDNDTGNAFFTFTLDVYTDVGFSNPPPNPIALDVPLYLKAEVVTQSAAPNLDLFPVSCWASSSPDEMSVANKVILITDGCGKDSEDTVNTLKYNCTDKSKTETFMINSFRFFDFSVGSSVYFHCDLRVCLIDASACKCPADPDCYNARKRKRRSADDFVEEVYVRAGPYNFGDDAEKEEIESEKQDEPQSFSTNVAIIVAVSGVVVAAVIVCATVYFVVRNRNKRRQDRDLNVVT